MKHANTGHFTQHSAPGKLVYYPGKPIPSIVYCDEHRRYETNELKKYVKPYTLTTDPETVVLGAKGTATELSDLVILPIDNKGHFEIKDMFATATNSNFTIEIFMPDHRPKLMNRECHAETVCSGFGTSAGGESFGAVGSAGRPFIWPETYWLNASDTGAGKAVFIRLRNLHTASNTIRITLHGLRWYTVQTPDDVQGFMEEVYRQRMRTFPFFYTTESDVSLGASASAEFDTRFTDEAWTEVVKLMARSSLAQGLTSFNCRIREKASTKRLMDLAIRGDLVFGDGEFPMLTWEPWLFEPNYKLTFELTNLIASTNDVHITLACRKVQWDKREELLVRPILFR